MTYKKMLVVLMASLFLFSVYKVSDYFYQSYVQQQINENIREQYHDLQQDELVQVESAQDEYSHDGVAGDEIERVMLNQFVPLVEMNEDVLGWINVPNTVIDYPVVQTDNNDYYLDHNIEQNSSKTGSIFMDFRNNGEAKDRHTILYGHHMRDGSMFKDLEQYSDQDFFERNASITFTTLYETVEWEIFSVYVTDTDFYYIQTDFRSNRDYVGFLNKLQDKSMFAQEDVDLSEDDQILTLSTCSYAFNDARLVVHAKKIQ